MENHPTESEDCRCEAQFHAEVMAELERQQQEVVKIAIPLKVATPPAIEPEWMTEDRLERVMK